MMKIKKIQRSVHLDEDDFNHFRETYRGFFTKFVVNCIKKAIVNRSFFEFVVFDELSKDDIILTSRK